MYSYLSKEVKVIQLRTLRLVILHLLILLPHFCLIPSGGDWAVHREVALVAEGIDGFKISNCLFYSPGGNGLLLNNYVRGAVIEGNEFVWVGDNAIVAVGST